LWNPVGITIANSVPQIGNGNIFVQKVHDDNVPALQKLAKRYLANNAENAETIHLLMSRNISSNLRDEQALQECIRRSEQDLLTLKALLYKTDTDHTSSIPAFNEQDLQVFGQRAAYQAQLRSIAVVQYESSITAAGVSKQKGIRRSCL